MISKDREFFRRRLRPDWKRRNLFGVYLEFWFYLVFIDEFIFSFIFTICILYVTKRDTSNNCKTLMKVIFYLMIES